MRHVIEIPPMNGEASKKSRLRVAAYCRVSTQHEEQDSSIELQMLHYENEIARHPEWINAGVFSDRSSGLKKQRKGKKKQAVIFNEQQIKQLIQAAKGTEMELVIDMELCLGLRRGELLGLQWGDIDWENKQIHIIRNRVIVDGKSVVKEPKTEAGIRVLDAPEMLMKKLRLHRGRCLENRMRLGWNYKVTDYIIVHPDGKPIYPEYLSQMLTKLLAKAGLPKCRFHDLRHLCASIMLLQGVNVKVAQERMGHKDIATTMNIYSHVLPSSARDAAEKIGQLVYAS